MSLNNVLVILTNVVGDVVPHRITGLACEALSAQATHQGLVSWNPYIIPCRLHQFKPLPKALAELLAQLEWDWVVTGNTGTPDTWEPIEHFINANVDDPVAQYNAQPGLERIMFRYTCLPYLPFCSAYPDVYRLTRGKFIQQYVRRSQLSFILMDGVWKDYTVEEHTSLVTHMPDAWATSISVVMK